MKNALEAKQYRVLITHNADLLKYICKAFFKWNGEKDEEGRALLQYVGTDVIREKYPDFWIEFISVMLHFFDDKWDYVIIPDCRFPNELQVLKADGFQTTHLRIERPNFESPLTESQRKHPSETSMDDIKAEFYIQNDGTLDDLSAKINDFVQEITK